MSASSSSSTSQAISVPIEQTTAPATQPTVSQTALPTAASTPFQGQSFDGTNNTLDRELRSAYLFERFEQLWQQAACTGEFGEAHDRIASLFQLALPSPVKQ